MTPARAVDGLLPPPITPAPAAPAVTHVTDGQNRVIKGTLATTADRRAQANALYAEAMLLPDEAGNDQPKALDLFRQVVALDPSFTDAQIKLANILLQTGQLDAALVQLEAVARAHPESIPVQVALGYTQRLRGQNEEAVKICARALAADPTQSVAMRVMLEVAAEQDDLAGGVVHVEDILRAGGDSVSAAAWLNLDRLYLEYARGQMNSPTSETVLRTRLPILQEAAAKPPPDVDTLDLLAKTYVALGRKLDGLKTMQRAVALDPTDAETVLHCGELEADLDRKDDAVRDFERAYALNPTMPGLRERLGALYLDTKRYADAAALYEKALTETPQDPSLEIDLGVAYEGMHRLDKAQACFQAVFNASGCPPEAYLELAFFQLEHDQIKQAGQTLAQAQQHFPRSARIRYYQAVQHRYEKNYDAALSCLAQVRQLATGADAGILDPNYYLEDALTLNLAGKKDQLETVLREGLGKFPDDPELMNELAYFWAEEGHHLDEALALSRRAGTLEPDNGPILDTCGWVYYQMGQPKDALPYLQRAAFMTNNDPVVLQHVGDAYWKLGERREALAAWTHALEKDPHNGDLTSRIESAEAQAKNAHSRSAPRP
ncbi:MAG: tetratricopeptide repeat protein [Verrucomicrobiota bacterium]